MELHLIVIGIGIFGGDDDNAVSTLRTVDSGCSCILEDVHRSDVTRRNIGNRAHRHTVHDIERVVALGKRRTTTHTDLHIRIRTSFCRSDRHTGQFTLQCLCCAGYRYILDLVCAHRSHGRYDVTFLCCTVTGYHHFLQHFAVLGKHYIHHIAGDGQFLRLHTDIREDEHFRIIRNLEGVVTVEIRYCTDGGTLHHYGSRDDRLSRLVLYCSADHTRLSHHAQQEQG